MTDEPNKTPAKSEPSELTTASSLQPFKVLRREIDRLFEDFDRGFWRSPFRSAWSLEPFFRAEVKWPAAPSADVTETDSEFKVTAELPGMDDKNVEVTLNDNILTIKGEKTEEKEEKKPNYHVQERHYGSFERRFPVPESVDAAKIEATFKQSVLTVVLPKPPRRKSRSKRSKSNPPDSRGARRVDQSSAPSVGAPLNLPARGQPPCLLDRAFGPRPPRPSEPMRIRHANFRVGPI